MGKSQVLGHGDGDDIPAGVDGGLLDSGDDFFSLSDADADLSFLVADNNNGSEMQLLPSLDDLGDSPDLNHPLVEAIPDLLLLGAGAKPSRLLHLGVHDVDVVSEDTDAAVGGAVELLIGSGDLILRLHGAFVEGWRGDEALGGLGGLVDCVVFVEFVGGEEGGVGVGGLGWNGAGEGERRGGGEGDGAGGDGSGGGGEEREARRGVERERGER